MSAPSIATLDLSAGAPGAPTAAAAPRPFLWSVRRELWENRSITIAPIVVAAVVLFSVLISASTLPRRVRAYPTLEPARQHASIAKPFQMAPAPIMLATFLIGLFYSLDALHGERRDRSILFWKSLPVSDTTTVLSKASIPLVVLPSIALVLGVATFVSLFVVSTGILIASGLGPATLWREVRFFREPLEMLYGLTAHALWFAPIHGWLLLISGWARRMPVLWAVMPLFVISLVERLAFGTLHFPSFLRYRVTGAMSEAFGKEPLTGSGGEVVDQLWRLTPGRFLSSPGLWLGLVFAAACLAAAVRLRRYREPI